MTIPANHKSNNRSFDQIRGPSPLPQETGAAAVLPPRVATPAFDLLKEWSVCTKLAHSPSKQKNKKKQTTHKMTFKTSKTNQTICILLPKCQGSPGLYSELPATRTRHAATWGDPSGRHSTPPANLASLWEASSPGAFGRIGALLKDANGLSPSLGFMVVHPLKPMGSTGPATSVMMETWYSRGVPKAQRKESSGRATCSSGQNHSGRLGKPLAYCTNNRLWAPL